MRALNKYVKSIILIYEAIENPILQRFLEIDTNFNPNYEYEPIDVDVDPLRHQCNGYQDVSSLFLVEGDKMFKTKKRFEQQKEGGANKGLNKQ
jgi:hypothetical protein